MLFILWKDWVIKNVTDGRWVIDGYMMACAKQACTLKVTCRTNWSPTIRDPSQIVLYLNLKHSGTIKLVSHGQPSHAFGRLPP